MESYSEPRQIIVKCIKPKATIRKKTQTGLILSVIVAHSPRNRVVLRENKKNNASSPTATTTNTAKQIGHWQFLLTKLVNGLLEVENKNLVKNTMKLMSCDFKLKGFVELKFSDFTLT